MENNEKERDETAGTGAGEVETASGPKRRPLWGVVIAAVSVIIIIVLIAVLVSGSSPGGPSVTVSIGAPDEVTAGGNFTVKVESSELINFDSANYDITYDPDVIELWGVTNGSIGATTIPIANWQFVPMGIQGTVRIIDNVPGFAGINGSGNLAEVHFKVVGSSGSTSSIAFTGDAGLFDNTAAEIPAKWVGGSVSVQ